VYQSPAADEVGQTDEALRFITARAMPIIAKREGC